MIILRVVDDMLEHSIELPAQFRSAVAHSLQLMASNRQS